MKVSPRFAGFATAFLIAANEAMAGTVNSVKFTATDEQRRAEAQAPTHKTQTEQTAEAVEKTGVRNPLGGLGRLARGTIDAGKAIKGAAILAPGSRSLLIKKVDESIKQGNAPVYVVLGDDKAAELVLKGLQSTNVTGSFVEIHANDKKGSNLENDWSGFKKSHGLKPEDDVVAIYTTDATTPVHVVKASEFATPEGVAAIVAKAPGKVAAAPAALAAPATTNQPAAGTNVTTGSLTNTLNAVTNNPATQKAAEAQKTAAEAQKAVPTRSFGRPGVPTAPAVPSVPAPKP